MKIDQGTGYIDSFGGAIRKIMKAPEIGILIPVLLLMIGIGIINPAFINYENIMNILRNTGFTFILGIAMTFVLISAGLDLSVGSVLAFGGIAIGMGVKAGLSLPLCFALAVILGAFIGLINGVIIVKLGIPPLIVTLGMMYVGRGGVLVLTKGIPVYPFPQNFNNIGQGSSLGVPNVVIIALILAIIAHLVLTRTRYGRAIFAIGGNEETARISGINVNFTKISVYVLSGIACVITGVLLAARLGSGQPTSGTGMEMTVIASVIIGGTSMFGGVGSILGSFIGALLMNVISNGMVVLKISVYWQNVAIGVIIVLAVGIDQLRRSKMLRGK